MINKSGILCTNLETQIMCNNTVLLTDFKKNYELRTNIN